jgi:hypothetical protein
MTSWMPLMIDCFPPTPRGKPERSNILHILTGTFNIGYTLIVPNYLVSNCPPPSSPWLDFPCYWLSWAGSLSAMLSTSANMSWPRNLPQTSRIHTRQRWSARSICIRPGSRISRGQIVNDK